MNPRAQWIQLQSGLPDGYAPWIGICVTTDGSVIACGSHDNDDPISRATAICYDSDGLELWYVESTGTSEGQFYSAGGAPDGGAVLVGTIYGAGTITFGSVNVTVTSTAGVVVKISSAGVFEWASTATNVGYMEEVHVAADGTILISGYVSTPGDSVFGSTTLTNPSGGTNGFVAKLSSTGSWLWATKADADTHIVGVEGVTADGSGGAWMGGAARRTAFSGAGTVTVTCDSQSITTPSGTSDYGWMGHINSSGVCTDLWFVSGSGNSEVHSVVSADGSTVYAVGERPLTAGATMWKYVDGVQQWRVSATSATSGAYSFAWGAAVADDGSVWMAGTRSDSTDALMFGDIEQYWTGDGNAVFAARVKPNGVFVDAVLGTQTDTSYASIFCYACGVFGTSLYLGGETYNVGATTNFHPLSAGPNVSDPGGFLARIDYQTASVVPDVQPLLPGSTFSQGSVLGALSDTKFVVIDYIAGEFRLYRVSAAGPVLVDSVAHSYTMSPNMDGGAGGDSPPAARFCDTAVNVGGAKTVFYLGYQVDSAYAYWTAITLTGGGLLNVNTQGTFGYGWDTTGVRRVVPAANGGNVTAWELGDGTILSRMGMPTIVGDGIEPWTLPAGETLIGYPYIGPGSDTLLTASGTGTWPPTVTVRLVAHNGPLIDSTTFVHPVGSRVHDTGDGDIRYESTLQWIGLGNGKVAYLGRNGSNNLVYRILSCNATTVTWDGPETVVVLDSVLSGGAKFPRASTWDGLTLAIGYVEDVFG